MWVLLLLYVHRSGGIQGGISNGEDIVLRVAFKPTSTIGIKQQTVTRAGACKRTAGLVLDALMAQCARCFYAPLAHFSSEAGGLQAASTV